MAVSADEGGTGDDGHEPEGDRRDADVQSRTGSGARLPRRPARSARPARRAAPSSRPQARALGCGGRARRTTRPQRVDEDVRRGDHDDGPLEQGDVAVGRGVDRQRAQPGRPKSVSTMTVVPIVRPRLTPASVMNENDDRRKASTDQHRHGACPGPGREDVVLLQVLDEVRRSTRVNTAISPSETRGPGGRRGEVVPQPAVVRRTHSARGARCQDFTKNSTRNSPAKAGYRERPSEPAVTHRSTAARAVRRARASGIGHRTR